MKKCELPKPKFDIDDLVAFNLSVENEERADGVPMPARSKRGAGTVKQIRIVKDILGKWNISYLVGDESESMQESCLKRVTF